MTSCCDTPDRHPPIESWDPGRGIHETTTRDCCHVPDFDHIGAYPTPQRHGTDYDRD